MRLVVTTPINVVVDEDRVDYIEAEDKTGIFGIKPRHAAFLTVLDISVLTWRSADNAMHHVALRGGVLTVKDDTVEVATREAVGEETLQRLGRAVLERFREETAEEERSRISAARVNVATIRQLQRYLESGRTIAPGEPLYKLARQEEEE